MNKKIEIDKEHILLASVSSGYPCETFSVSETYINNGEIIKSLEFTIWDDMAFYVFCNNDKLDNIEFEFDINHPLYFSIKKLLGCDKQLIIDDDSTAADLKKYMVIKQEDEKYKFIFFNTKNKENYDYYNFGVFIKNILPDARSKISDLSIKLRLVDFFRNVQTNLLEEYHQITLDECLEFINNKSKTLTSIVLTQVVLLDTFSTEINTDLVDSLVGVLASLTIIGLGIYMIIGIKKYMEKE